MWIEEAEGGEEALGVDVVLDGLRQLVFCGGWQRGDLSRPRIRAFGALDGQNRCAADIQEHLIVGAFGTTDGQQWVSHGRLHWKHKMAW